MKINFGEVNGVGGGPCCSVRTTMVCDVPSGLSSWVAVADETRAVMNSKLVEVVVN